MFNSTKYKDKTNEDNKQNMRELINSKRSDTSASTEF